MALWKKWNALNNPENFKALYTPFTLIQLRALPPLLGFEIENFANKISTYYFWKIY